MKLTLPWVEDAPDDLLLGERVLVEAGFEKPEIVRDWEQAIAYLTGAIPAAVSGAPRSNTSQEIGL